MAESFAVPFAGGITALFGARRSSLASLHWLGFGEYVLHLFRSTTGLPGGHPVYCQVFLQRAGQCRLPVQSRHMQSSEWFPAKPSP